jgi:hypothetical protein
VSSQAVRDTAEIIRKANTKAQVWRSGAAVTKVNGVVPGPATLIASDQPVKVDFLTPKTLAEIGASAAGMALPNSPIKENDYLIVTGPQFISGVKYRVSEINPRNFEGEVTHLDLHLERMKEAGNV